jgi:protein-S-isoprenylcysteine O-methyltransferase Ste14
VWAIGALEQPHQDASGRQGRDIASLTGAVLAIAALALPASLWSSLTFASRGTEIAGAALLVPATAAAIWSRIVLGSMWSSAARINAERALRTDGPYAVTRHPIYTAIVAMLIGTMLTQGFGRWVLISLAITLVLESKIASEERLLAQEFPDQYASYRTRVPQLVPRPSTRRGATDGRR